MTFLRMYDLRQSQQHLSRFKEITATLKDHSSDKKIVKKQRDKAGNLLKHQQSTFYTALQLCLRNNLQLETKFSLMSQSVYNNLDQSFWFIVNQVKHLQSITESDYKLLNLPFCKELLEGEFEGVQLTTHGKNSLADEISLAILDGYEFFKCFLGILGERFKTFEGYFAERAVKFNAVDENFLKHSKILKLNEIKTLFPKIYDSCLEMLAVSGSECLAETAFSVLDYVVSSRRSLLKPSTIDSIMSLYLTLPPLSLIDPEFYVDVIDTVNKQNFKRRQWSAFTTSKKLADDSTTIETFKGRRNEKSGST